MTTKGSSPAAYANAIVKAWGDNFPIKVRDVAFDFTRTQKDPIVKIESLDVPSIEGFLAKSKGNRWGIAFSSSIREPGKVNFTIAHELGHYLLHRANRERIVCLSDDMTDFPNKDSESTNIEQEANEFSSFLLMPIHDFRKQVDGNRINLELLDHCAKRYDTTVTAASLKLISFCEKPIVVISATRGEVRWSRSSKPALKKGIFFRRGTAIPQGTLSRQCCDGGFQVTNLKGQAANPVHWSKETGWVIESVISQPYYNSTLTLLEFER